ncbi:alpha/beta hydrolase [Xylaria cf. heliscus]|nr:alpha/beta hydrolase [Xylaria cf. heliscus]
MPARSTGRNKTYSTNSTAAERDSQTLKLPDGRVLGFAEYGSPTGKPIFFFHGFPSSRLEADGILKLVHRQDLRIIAPERPGFGLSTFQPQHRITDWPADVRALATHLGLDRFAILGGSGGAPYALACARAFPAETLSAVGLLAPAAPWEAGIAGVPRSSRIMALMAYYWPASVRVITAGIVALCRWLAATNFVARRIDRWLESSKKEKAASTPSSSSLPAASEASPSASPTSTMTTQETRVALLRSVFEPFRQGTAPMVRESQLLTWEGWGLPLDEVRYDKVVIWHGVEDGQSPIHMVRYLAKQLPHCELRELEGETHFTMVKHLGAILEELVPLDGEGGGGGQGEGKGKGA